ncbi:hypothetical protein ACC691_38850, partial [Rhizobium johnstonii]|uniref:hypothetical protein n=1 Tax=Rhizobium johnstonii TaxID=3019933 RepID=UPI003F96EF6F
AKHWWELPESRRTIVQLDIAHRGVGTAQLGPDTRPEFRLTDLEYHWSWRLRLESAADPLHHGRNAAQDGDHSNRSAK